MSVLFDETEINGMSMRNRFVRSATWEGMADDEGRPTSDLIRLYRDLVEGGVGLIITGFSYVNERGKAAPHQLGSYKDELVQDLRGITKSVHEKNSKIILQIAHGGLFADSNLIDGPLIGPSRFQPMEDSDQEKMSIRDIEMVEESFARAAKRAKEAGFDGVQLHLAHGYLLSQFLSPVFNKRDDKYGGSIENRARISIEILKAVRNEVGRNYPVLAKINCRDFVDDGLTLADSIQASKMLEKAGIDAIEVSGGLLINPKKNPSRTNIQSEEDEAYFEGEAKSFREELGVDLMLVGGIRSFEVAERIVSENTADYISISRPLIREPNLISRWRSGDKETATCISCNKCLEVGGTEGIYCVVEDEGKD